MKEIKKIIIEILIILIGLSLSSCSLESLRKDIIGIEIDTPIPIQNSIIDKTPNATKLIFKNSKRSSQNKTITEIETVTPDLKQYETIYRIGERDSINEDIKTFIVDRKIFIRRSKNNADTLAIDKFGKYISKEHTLDINPDGLLSKSGNFYAYKEDQLSTNLPNTITVFDLKNNRKNIITSEESYAALLSVTPLSFSQDDKILYAIGIDKNNNNYLFDINLDDYSLSENLISKNILEEYKDISIIKILKDNLFFTISDKNNYALYKRNIQSGEQIEILNANTEIQNILSSTTNDYIQYNSNIFSYSEGSTYKILENSNLVDVSNDNAFLIYTKKNTFDDNISFYIFDLENSISKKIYDQDSNSNIEYIGMVQ